MYLLKNFLKIDFLVQIYNRIYQLNRLYRLPDYRNEKFSRNLKTFFIKQIIYFYFYMDFIRLTHKKNFPLI